MEKVLLVDDEELIRKSLRIFFGAEITSGIPPFADSAGHAVDQLPDAVFALGGSDVSAEVFRDDHVGGELRPGLRYLGLGLLENDFTVLVADLRASGFPLDEMVGIFAGGREMPRDRRAPRSSAFSLLLSHSVELPSPQGAVRRLATFHALPFMPAR